MIDQKENGSGSNQEEEGDLRFDTPSISGFGKEFKKQIKDEERLAKTIGWKARTKNKLIGKEKNVWINFFITIFDFSFSLYVCGAIIMLIVYTIPSAIRGDWSVTLCCSLLIWLLVKINEKISR